MFIKILGMYHMDPNNDKYSSYWQKVGKYAFQFTPNKENASKLTQEEVDNILRYEKHYCSMYGARKMVVVDSL